MFEKLLSRAEKKFGRYGGIPKLMMILCVGMGIAFVADYLLSVYGISVSGYLSFQRSAILRGQVWRLVSFVFLPPSSSPLFLLISLMFYWYLGNTLQSTWGTFRFTAYYLCGMLGAIIAGFLTGYTTNSYLNMSLFLACAILYPDTEVNLIVIPIKMKWMALIYLLPVLQTLLSGNLLQIVALVMSLLNVVLFFYGDLIQRIRDYRRRQQWKKNWR